MRLLLFKVTHVTLLFSLVGPLGDTELSLDLTLAQARAKLSALLNVPFDFDAGWRYLQYS